MSDDLFELLLPIFDRIWLYGGRDRREISFTMVNSSIYRSIPCLPYVQNCTCNLKSIDMSKNLQSVNEISHRSHQAVYFDS